MSIENFKFIPKTDKQKRLDYMRREADTRYQQLHTSSPEDVRKSESVLAEQQQNSEPITPASNDHVIDVSKFCTDLKYEAQIYRDPVSEMVFGSRSASEMKVALSEYGQRLLSDRKMRESSQIMLQHLASDQTELGKAIQALHSQKAENITVEKDPADKEFLTMVKNLRSQLSEEKIDQAKVTYQEIQEKVTQHMITEADPTTRVVQDGTTDEQKNPVLQQNRDNMAKEREYIISWLDIDHQVQKQLIQENTGNQDGKVHTDDPEAMSKYFEHLLARSPDLSMTAFVTRLGELHDLLIQKIDEHIENSAVTDGKLSDNLRNIIREKKFQHGIHGSFIGMKSSESKARRNEILWNYVTSLHDLQKLEVELQRQIKETKSEIKSLNENNEQNDDIQVEQKKVELNEQDDSIQVEHNTEEDIKVKEKTIASDVCSWPPLNAHKIKEHYPKDVELNEVWSVLSNFGKQKLESKQHDQRLEAIALRGTEWLIDHGWDVSSNAKKEDLYEKVRQGFIQTKNEEMPIGFAKKLFECVIRQDEKDKQAWLKANYSRIGKKQQLAKMDLVHQFEKDIERYHRVERKAAQFDDIPGCEKIFRREKGYKYRSRHETDINKHEQGFLQDEKLRWRLEMQRQLGEEGIKEFEQRQEKFKDYRTKLSNEELSTEDRQKLESEAAMFIAQSIYDILHKMKHNQKMAAIVNQHQMDNLTKRVTKALEHNSHGVWSGVILHGGEAVLSVGAFILSILTITAVL